MTRPKAVKPTPSELMEDTGTGLDYGTRPDRIPGYLVPNDRFFIRSHAPTPQVDAANWALRIEGNGVRRPVTYTYAELWERFPLVSMIRTIECAGNRRVLLGNECGRTFDGTPWGRGAIGTAEWTGVRLADLLAPAAPTSGAREIMPESLDASRFRRPMPLAKAMASDTLVALAMNGEILLADHGFPARVVVTGWLGAASVKWLTRIEVSEEPLYAPWNTEDYVLIGPGFPAEGPARGPAITTVPVAALVELPWPARLRPEPQVIRGRAFAGENAVAAVDYRIDGGHWQCARLDSPGEAGTWARWQFPWAPEPGEHVLQVRATDDRGGTQPEASACNELGYLQHSVLSHPVRVEAVSLPRCAFFIAMLSRRLLTAVSKMSAASCITAADAAACRARASWLASSRARSGGQDLRGLRRRHRGELGRHTGPVDRYRGDQQPSDLLELVPLQHPAGGRLRPQALWQHRQGEQARSLAALFDGQRRQAVCPRCATRGSQQLGVVQ